MMPERAEPIGVRRGLALVLGRCQFNYGQFGDERRIALIYNVQVLY